MSFWDYIFPARRRRREEECRSATPQPGTPQRAYAAHVASTRQASPDTSFDLTSPLNLMSPLHPFNPMNPINLGASFHVPSASASSHGEPSSHPSGGSDSGSSYSGSSDSGGSSSGGPSSGSGE